MSRRLIAVVAGFVFAVPVMVGAQSSDDEAPDPRYPRDVLERYYECMERHDLDKIRELLWYHHNVERIDASIYGLPKNDFDDRSLLTIEERLKYRRARREEVMRDRSATRMLTRGPVQYPHHLRETLDELYERTGERPDCSHILEGQARDTGEDDRGAEPGWASDRNLTSLDSNERGEVDIVIDYANPNRILASSCPSGASPDSSSNFITASDDWGQTWTQTAVGNNSGSTWECDPVSYYQRSTGNVYHSKIGCSNGMCSQTYTMMRYSTDNGATWSDCGRPGSDTAEDRQWHVVDNTPSSPCYGNIYATWHNSNQEKVTTSTDNCASWDTPTNLTGTYEAITPDINVAADGHVYVVWQNHGDATFKIAGSSDCGATWTAPSPTTLKSRLGDWSNNIPAQCQRGIATQPQVDVDRCPWSAYYGRVYVVMFDFDQSGCGSGPGCSDWSDSCDYDVWFMYSDDEGQSWSSPVNVTRDILGHGDMVDSFMGYMRVDESDGSIYLAYHRTRLNPSSLEDREKTHYYLARSIDGGQTWSEIQVSTLEGDEKVSGADSFERGDYNRLDVVNGVIYPVWIDRRDSGGEEEIVTRKVCTEPTHQSERAPTFSAPATTVTDAGGGQVDISWAAPDAHWGDGGEDNSQRKYQLYVDGALAQDDIAWTTTSIAGYDPGDCNSHDYFIRAINQCGVEKDYATTSHAATGCCTGNPDSVDVTPDGPLVVCDGTSQTLSISLTGGTSPFAYQWYRDGSAISGAMSSTYDANDTGTHAYNCEVTGSGCTTGVQDGSATQITWQSAPTFAGITSATNGEVDDPCTVNLEWSPASTPCPGPVTYNVYRDGSPIATGVTCSGSPCTYADTDSLVSGTEYTYMVRAYDTSTGVEDSNTVEASATPTGTVTTGTWTEDFESSPAGWSFNGLWHEVNGTSCVSPSAASGTVAWYYGQDSSCDYDTGSATTGSLTSPTIQGVSSSSDLSFNYWREVESYSGAYDITQVDVSYDGGSSWTQVWYRDANDSSSAAWTASGAIALSPPSSPADMLIRFTFDSVDTTSNNFTGWLIDDVSVTNVNVQADCVTGSSCTDPGQPVISSVDDEDGCAQSGVRVNYTAGSGASSHDLYVDGSQMVTGYASGDLYDPGDEASHSYVVRAIDQTCYTDSDPVSGTDDDGSVPQAGAPTVTDDDECVQSGVTVSWSAVDDATSYDLLIDGTTTISGVTSPYGYDPGDTASHDYQVRGSNAACGDSAWSTATSAADADGIPTPDAPGVTDVSSCAQSGVEISWSSVSGATSYDLLVDGTTTVSGVSSPYTYDPGDTASHTYQVRGRSASCTGGYSSSTSGTDADHAMSFAGIATAADRDVCDDTGVVVTWNLPASWNDGGSGTRSFTVTRDGADLATGISETTTSYVDTTGTNGADYAYGVRAVNGYGCANDGGIKLTASDQVGAPPTFAGLQSVTAMPSDVCGLRLEWSAATSNCSAGPGIVYNVYRSTTSGFGPDGTTLLTSCVADLYYEDTGLTGGTTYYYVVRAEDSSVGHGGPCNDGFEDSNTVEMSGTVGGGGTQTVTVYADDFDGNQTPADYWNTGYTFGNPYTSGDCTSETYADDWHIPQTNFCTGNTAASNDGVSPYDYSDPGNGALILGDPPTGGGPPYSDGGIVLPSGATSITLTFNHDYDFERGWWSTYYDGGRVMISVDDWPNFTAIAPSGGYPGSVANTTSYCHPWPGGDAYVGDSGGCVSATFDLTGYGGERIWLAWNHGADNWDTSDDGWMIDDVLIQAEVTGTDCSSAADPVEHFTARSTSGEVKLEWVNPSASYGSTRICVDTVGYPTDPSTCTVVADQVGTAGAYDTLTHTGRTNGTTYYYSAFVDNGAGDYSARRTVAARPFDTSGQVTWEYASAATALAPNGVYPGAIGTGSTYAVSNDRVLHGMNPTTAGGDWPRTSPYAWVPMAMNGPAQARPPVVPTTVGASDLVVFLGSEDGHAYAADARTGTTLWQSPLLGNILLASPSGMFSDFGGAYDLLFIGSRDAGTDNAMYALDPADGTSVKWTFDNGGGIGIINSSAAVDYDTSRVYFASRERSASSNQTVWCLDVTDTGATLGWSRALGDIDGAPLLYDGRLYVGNNSGVVYALDPTDGSTIWSYATTDGPVKGYVMPEFVDIPRRLYFSTTSTVWSLTDEGTTASVDWQRSDVAGPSIPLVPAGATEVYVGSTDGRLYQLSASTGTPATSVTLGDGTGAVGSPANDVVNGTAYVGTESGAVYCVSLPLQ